MAKRKRRKIKRKSKKSFNSKNALGFAAAGVGLAVGLHAIGQMSN